MATLKSQADKEQSEFESEWKELGKMIEQAYHRLACASHSIA